MGKLPYFSLNYSKEALEAFLEAARTTFPDTRDFVTTAFLRALNEQAGPMKKLGLKLVLEHYTLKKGGAKKRYDRAVKLIGATRGRPFLIYRAESRGALPIGDFKTFTGKRKGVHVQPVQGGPISPVRLSGRGDPIYKGFWFRGANSGKRLVGMRDPRRKYITKPREVTRVVETKTKGRRTYTWIERPHEVEGFRAVLGPDIIAWLGKREPKSVLRDTTFARFRSRFVHHLEWYLANKDKLKGKRR